MSDSSRKRKPGGGVPRWAVIGGVLLAVLLIANLALGLKGFLGDEGEPTGFLTPEMLWGSAYWVPVAVLGWFSAFALFWTSSAFKRTERASLRWNRRGFLWAIMATTGLSMASYEPELFPRRELITLAIVALSILVVLFALGARTDHNRGQASEGAPRRRKRKGGEDGDDDEDREEDGDEAGQSAAA